MTDVVDSQTRSRMMAGIRSRDTKPELLVRRYLHAQGFRYRLNVRSLPGSPDLVLAKWRTVIFVHGCFWHRHPGCTLAYTPKSRQAFWLEKFEKNVARDLAAIKALEEAGWRVIVVWECTLRKNGQHAALAGLVQKIRGEDGNGGDDRRSV
ncbi:MULTISPECIES: very short patch repair endonuclease [Comamonas]|uniref:very short patch repair endonuclease n=1 Tax=Comamonas TaxID=283 RepID=UPI00257C038F|nr:MULTISPECIES: DNA mismatch endonuclease Vsr [Comamonas]